jgi:hypothetical protein
VYSNIEFEWMKASLMEQLGIDEEQFQKSVGKWIQV